MKRRVRISASEAEALREARFRCRLDSPAELLSAVVAGDQAAMEALRATWPHVGDGAEAQAEAARLRREAKEAGARLNAELVARLADRIGELEAEHPELGLEDPRRLYVSLPVEVIDTLLELARTVPRVGPGRASAVDGIRVLLNGHQNNQSEG